MASVPNDYVYLDYAATLPRAPEENNMMTARADRLPAMRRAAL